MEKPEIMPLLDIHLSTFLWLKGFVPVLRKQGTRVTFDFPASQEVLRWVEEYNHNPAVPILDFVNSFRKLKAQMFALK